MTLILKNSKDVDGSELSVKTWGIPGLPDVRFGNYDLTMEDFLAAAWYILTNTDLRAPINPDSEKNDPRVLFVEDIKKLSLVEGHNFSQDQYSIRLGIPPKKE